MSNPEDLQKELQKEIESLRDRLSRLSRAGRRITGDLDLDTVLQEIVDEARSLTGAGYGVLAVMNGDGGVEAVPSLGLTPEEFQGSPENAKGSIYQYLGTLLSWTARGKRGPCFNRVSPPTSSRAAGLTRRGVHPPVPGQLAGAGHGVRSKRDSRVPVPQHGRDGGGRPAKA